MLLLANITSTALVHGAIALAAIVGAAFSFKARREIWFRILIWVLALMVAGRMFTRYYAWSYGSCIGGAFMTLGRSGFADTKALEEWFASADLADLEKKAVALPFCGGGYSTRIGDLKTGLRYLSAQVSLPPSERFQKLPHLKTLRFQTSDRSEQGIIDSTFELIMGYRSSI